MKYTPVNVEEENVNVSKESPLKKVFVLSALLLGLIIISYLSLGFIAETIAVNLPPSMEKEVGRIFSKCSHCKRLAKEEEKLKTLLNELIIYMPKQDSKRIYNVYLLKNKQFNAHAAPGGNIYIYEGLLKEIENEQELAFVMAHELGHAFYKDPIRTLGRRYASSIITQIVFGSDNFSQALIQGSTGTLELKFSRDAEKRADLFATDLICKKYGNANGAIAFMEKIEQKKKLKLPKFMYYFSTHPSSKDRIKYIREYAQVLETSL